MEKKLDFNSMQPWEELNKYAETARRQISAGKKEGLCTVAVRNTREVEGKASQVSPSD